MRRDMAIARIFLFLSFVNYALAAPVTARGAYGMHADVVDVSEDGAATSQKRDTSLGLTYSFLTPSSDYFPSPSNLLRPRDDPDPPVDSPQNEDDLTSSRLGAGTAESQESESSTDNTVDSPRTKNFLLTLTGSRPGAGPSKFADSKGFPEPDPSQDPGSTEPETKDFLSLLDAGSSNLAGPSQGQGPVESETKEILGQFLEGKFKRRISGQHSPMP